MMNPTDTKFSGGKIANLSDFREGTKSDRIAKKVVNSIATCNVRSLVICGNLGNITLEIRRLNIDIL